MAKLRAIMFLIGQIIFTLVYFPVVLLAMLLPLKIRLPIIAVWAHMNVHWARITAGIKHQVTGLENIPNEPCIIACNHQSMWETIAPQTFLPRHIWVLKKELLRIPIFGWGLAATKPIAIDRNDKRGAMAQIIEQGKQRLAEGRYVLIYPEGTRMPLGKIGKFKVGAAKLAEAANVPIVPMVHNGAKYWPRDNMQKHPGTVECRIGKPISTEGKKYSQVIAELKTWIEGNQP